MSACSHGEALGEGPPQPSRAAPAAPATPAEPAALTFEEEPQEFMPDDEGPFFPPIFRGNGGAMGEAVGILFSAGDAP